jgi:hypothetical protein
MMIRTAKSETKKVAVSILLLSHRDTLLFPPTGYSLSNAPIEE